MWIGSSQQNISLITFDTVIKLGLDVLWLTSWRYSNVYRQGDRRQNHFRSGSQRASPGSHSKCVFSSSRARTEVRQRWLCLGCQSKWGVKHISRFTKVYWRLLQWLGVMRMCFSHISFILRLICLYTVHKTYKYESVSIFGIFRQNNYNISRRKCRTTTCHHNFSLCFTAETSHFLPGLVLLPTVK